MQTFRLIRPPPSPLYAFHAAYQFFWYEKLAFSLTTPFLSVRTYFKYAPSSQLGVGRWHETAKLQNIPTQCKYATSLKFFYASNKFGKSSNHGFNYDHEWALNLDKQLRFTSSSASQTPMHLEALHKPKLRKSL